MLMARDSDRRRNSTRCFPGGTLAVSGAVPTSVPSTQTADPGGSDSTTSVPEGGAVFRDFQAANPLVPAIATIAIEAAAASARAPHPSEIRSSEPIVISSGTATNSERDTGAAGVAGVATTSGSGEFDWGTGAAAPVRSG